ncbi:MAG TPA: hypothetical protein VNO51_18485 [Ilumatobacteraceae bacterium]|nr:hypothetical protein [Ilumatobacteraceae bacterium]
MARASDYDSIGIGLPREWATLPIEQRAFETMCDDLRRRWRDDPDWDRPTERRAELLLARVRAEMRKVGIKAAAMYVESLGNPAEANAKSDVDTEAEAEVLMATVTFGIYTRADLETKLPLTLANLAAAFSAPPRRTHEYKRITNLELPALYELRPGKSIRLRRLYELEKPGRLPDRFYGESFVLPLGDDNEACGILNFVTTNIDLASNFTLLFASIADTVTLWTPDDETAYEPRAAEPAPEAATAR